LLAGVTGVAGVYGAACGVYGAACGTKLGVADGVAGVDGVDGVDGVTGVGGEQYIILCSPRELHGSSSPAQGHGLAKVLPVQFVEITQQPGSYPGHATHV
jgi:hypothetical protein